MKNSKIWPRFLSGSVLLLANVTFIPFASAHTVLVDSTPAINSTISQLPSTLTLKFADNLLQIPGKSLNSVSVTDSMNMEIATRVVIKANTLTASLHETMAMAGVFNVRYRVAAPDGHVVEGKFIFTVGATSTQAPTVKIPQSGTQNLVAHLSGDLAGVKNSSASATANLAFDFGKKDVCYTISQNGLAGITEIHVHPMMQSGNMKNMNMTISDEVFIALDKKSVGSTTPICSPVKPLMMAEIVANPGHYAVMIHTKSNPDGAVAGILAKSR
jgi:copper resistance protein C